jgi:preprotein translocase subunit SecE
VRGVACRMVWPSRKSSKKLPGLVLVMASLMFVAEYPGGQG